MAGIESLGNINTYRRLGIMGGTFDPIHFGHLVAAEEARVQYQLEHVVFMPTGRYEHKEARQYVSPEERFTMVVIATASNPYFSVSRLEVDRAGSSYTIDTIRAVSEACGTETELYFITGADAVLDVTSWRDYEKLADFCRFIAVTRPGYDLAHLRAIVSRGENAPQIDTIEVPALAISSTDLRNRVSEGRPIRYLMPDSVANYIHKSGLYR